MPSSFLTDCFEIYFVSSPGDLSFDHIIDKHFRPVGPSFSFDPVFIEAVLPALFPAGFIAALRILPQEVQLPQRFHRHIIHIIVSLKVSAHGKVSGGFTCFFSEIPVFPLLHLVCELHFLRTPFPDSILAIGKSNIDKLYPKRYNVFTASRNT